MLAAAGKLAHLCIAAEIYGFGKSEELLGEFMQKTGSSDKAMVATKFATLPWRFTSHSVVQACKASNPAALSSLNSYTQHFLGITRSRCYVLGPYVQDLCTQICLYPLEVGAACNNGC